MEPQSPKALQLLVSLRNEIVDLLNLQYSTDRFSTKPVSFHQLVKITQQALKNNHDKFRIGLEFSSIFKYSIKLTPSNQDPFSIQQRQALSKLIMICELLILSPDYKLLYHLKQYLNNEYVTPHLTPAYKNSSINFHYLGIKDALIFTALTQCKIWFTICKERRKSGKQFELDSIINLFDRIKNRWSISDPYHQSILPKKQLKHIQKKNNVKKINNPLFQAIKDKNINKLKQIILNGFSIETPAILNQRQHNVEIRATHQACSLGQLQICKVLHTFQADWEAQDQQKMSPIFYAILSGSLDIIKFLVQQVKVNLQKQEIQKRTPFYWACTQGDIKIIEYLYSRGANINHKSALGRTALSKSCYLGRLDIVKYLLSRKQIDILSQDNKGRSALHNAVFGPKGGRQGHKFGTNDKDSPQCAQILLQKKFPVDLSDYQQNTSLHIAMSSQAVDSIRLLMAFGASLTVVNNYKQTPLLTGAKFGHKQSCRILIQQYNADFTVKDIFDKNILLLTAKFNQQDGNQVFFYILDKYMAKMIQNNTLEQIQKTFGELLTYQRHKQLQALVKSCDKFKIQLPIFRQVKQQILIKQVMKILQIPVQRSQLIIRLLSQLKKIPTKLFSKALNHLIIKNQLKMLQFLYKENQHLLLGQQGQPLLIDFSQIAQELPKIKQKVLTFCLLTLNVNWLHYRDSENGNIFHNLVKKSKIGTIIQLLKVLSGIKMPFVHNITIPQNEELLKQNLKRLLMQKDNEGFDAYQYSLILKEHTIIKLLQEKIKSIDIKGTGSNTWDVKEYSIEPEQDCQKLELFNKYQLEQQLEQLLQKIEHDPQLTLKPVNWNSLSKEFFLKEWNKLHQRQFILCMQEKQLVLMEKQLLIQQIIGIDLQYFQIGTTLVISTLQLSSPKKDYILDMLTLHTVSLIPLTKIRQYLSSIFQNPAIIKIMHGSDNDLHIIKTNLNLSLLNFLDTSRLDLQHHVGRSDLRGLSALCGEYLGVQLSKDFQVSQWRVRPLPKAMLNYARIDSMVLPYLLCSMINQIKQYHKQSSNEKIKGIIINGCKQARKNKKNNQILIKEINLVKYV